MGGGGGVVNGLPPKSNSSAELHGAAGEKMNLQILARQNLCHFLEMSEQIIYSSKLLMRNSRRLLLFPSGLWF